MDEYAPETYSKAGILFEDIFCRHLVPQIVAGIQAIARDAHAKCLATNEMGKYYDAIQIELSSVARWNENLIQAECDKIKSQSGCNYMDELLNCMFITHTKLLTCIRVGNRQKRIDLACPKFPAFVHKVYLESARRAFTNVYLFEPTQNGLTVQRNNRSLELLVRESVSKVVIDALPTETIIRAYLEEAMEIEEEVVIEPVPLGTSASAALELPATNAGAEAGAGGGSSAAGGEADALGAAPTLEPMSVSVTDLSTEPVVTRLTFNDIDSADTGEDILAPKTVERLEALGAERHQQRLAAEDAGEDGGAEDAPLKIGAPLTDADLGIVDLMDSAAPPLRVAAPPAFDLDITEL